MTLLLSLAVATLFGCGAYLMLRRDLTRMVAGVLLISNSATLFVISAGLRRGQAPIYPLAAGARIADPLAQALALTSIVITFGVIAVLLCLVYRVFIAHDTLDLQDLAQAEVADQAALELEES
ncbi:MAG: sodium:proton antiporter [Chloroflexota bacterium]